MCLLQAEFPDPVVFLLLNKDYTTKDLSKNNFTTTAVGVTLSSDTAPDGQTDGSYYFPGSASGYIEIPQDPKLDIRYEQLMRRTEKKFEAKTGLTLIAFLIRLELIVSLIDNTNFYSPKMKNGEIAQQ